MLPPLTWAALAFLSGLVIAESINIAPSAIFAITAGTVLLGVMVTITGKRRSWLFRKHIRLGLSPILIFFCCVGGIVRFQLINFPPSSDAISQYNGIGIVTIHGIICEYPDRRDAFQLITVKARNLSIAGDQNIIGVTGRLIVRTGIGPSYSYGDELLLTGNLITPSDEADFSYKNYLARRSIHSSIYYPEIVLISEGRGNPFISWIYSLRDKGLAVLSIIYPMPESALIKGILLGMDNDIPADIQSAFRATGTTHIIAISGFNISILAALFSAFFYRLLGIRKGAVATTFSLFIYVILCGGSPSVVRAAIMGSLGLFAGLLGRRQVAINTLAFVAAIMCLSNPYLPWDISFQLSFLSTLGLILFAKPMVDGVNKLFTRFLPSHSLERLAERVGEYCLFTIAALITTFPVMAYHFQSLSFSSLIANPLILPAQPLVMILGGLSLLLGMIWVPLGQLFAAMAWPFVAYTIRVVEWLGNQTVSNPNLLSVGMGFIAVYYLTLCLFYINQKVTLIKRILQPNMLILACLAITVILWRLGLGLPDSRLHIYLFDNGPSENLLIRSPEGRYILINAGSQSTTLADALGKRLPPGNRELDIVFLPVKDRQAIRSITHGISGISIGSLVWLGNPKGMATARMLEQDLGLIATKSTDVEGDLSYPLLSGSFLTYHPLTEDGGLFTVSWRKFRMLIPINVTDAKWLEAVLTQNTSCDYSALMLAGNGSYELNPPSLLRRLNSTLILATTDPGQLGDVSQTITQSGQVLTTGQNGWIHITTDGDHLWVETAQKPK